MANSSKHIEVGLKSQTGAVRGNSNEVVRHFQSSTMKEGVRQGGAKQRKREARQHEIKKPKSIAGKEKKMRASKDLYILDGLGKSGRKRGNERKRGWGCRGALKSRQAT